MIKILLIITALLPDGRLHSSVMQGGENETIESCEKIYAPLMKARLKDLYKEAIEIHARCVIFKRKKPGVGV